LLHNRKMEPPTPSPSISTSPTQVFREKCYNATDFIPTRFTDGVNFLRDYYECSCTGDFDSLFTLSCALENYCLEKNGTEQCITRKETFEFVVDSVSGEIEKMKKNYACVEYLSGSGPYSGPLCWVSSNPCAISLKNDHGYAMTEASNICTDSSVCRSTLESLGYLAEEIENVCPFTTLNGKRCTTDVNKKGICKDGFFEGTGRDAIHEIRMPDCSNVEPCATASCQQFKLWKESPKDGFIMRFPECVDAPFPKSSSSKHFCPRPSNSGVVGIMFLYSVIKLLF